MPRIVCTDPGDAWAQFAADVTTNSFSLNYALTGIYPDVTWGTPSLRTTELGGYVTDYAVDNGAFPAGHSLPVGTLWGLRNATGLCRSVWWPNGFGAITAAFTAFKATVATYFSTWIDAWALVATARNVINIDLTHTIGTGTLKVKIAGKVYWTDDFGVTPVSVMIVSQFGTLENSGNMSVMPAQDNMLEWDSAIGDSILMFNILTTGLAVYATRAFNITRGRKLVYQQRPPVGLTVPAGDGTLPTELLRYGAVIEILALNSKAIVDDTVQVQEDFGIVAGTT